MQVNEEKSKIVIFRNNGRVKDSECWHIGDDVLEIVNQFTYLGILLNFNNKFTKTIIRTRQKSIVCT